MLIWGARAVARGGIGVDVRCLMQRMVWFEGCLSMYLYEPIHMDRKC